MEEVKVGDKIPSVILKEGQPDYGAPRDVNISDLIAGKRVAIFAVPGAFTPGMWVLDVDDYDPTNTAFAFSFTTSSISHIGATVTPIRPSCHIYQAARSLTCRAS
jgi:peroxiredoxin